MGHGGLFSWRGVVMDATVSFNRGSASLVDDYYKTSAARVSAAFEGTPRVSGQVDRLAI
jgi:hypothetical protein